MSKHVESWWIQKFNNGIIQLMINTSIRWLGYHEYTQGSYWIGHIGTEDENECKDQDCTLNIPVEKFEFQTGTRYLPLHIQEKDQIMFYYVPYNMISRENGTIIADSKKTE